MSGSIKQIKTTGNFSLSKFNLQTTEFANPKSRKLAGFDVAFVEKWENFKLPSLIFGSLFCNLSRISVENHLFKKTVGVTDHPSELNPSKVNATDTIPS